MKDNDSGESKVKIELISVPQRMNSGLVGKNYIVRNDVKWLVRCSPKLLFEHPGSTLYAVPFYIH